jgi:hydroxymethylpyrimidine pyrophosphatase-like HAD family hydrolase
MRSFPANRNAYGSGDRAVSASPPLPPPPSIRDTTWFRAIAVDYDGTLATNDTVDPAVLDALDRWRGRGGKVVLVTGRIVDELQRVFPTVHDHVDLVVAENGAVLCDAGGTTLLARPVDAELSEALTAKGVRHRSGEAILATHDEYEDDLEVAIRELGLEVQVVRNRGEVMVLPAGVSKGTGVRVGLRTLGLSPHSALAIGDAENDHSLLLACETGVAVANAVPSLFHDADLVTRHASGRGVVEVLDGPYLQAGGPRPASHWRVALGRRPDGTLFTLPASQVDLLLCGRSGGGKSFVAGLIAEQLIELGYSVVVIDPEGDHAALAELPSVVYVGSGTSHLQLDHLVALIQQHLGSLIVDLSLQPPEARHDFYRGAPAALDSIRATRGVPHWIVIDEAHESLDREGSGRCLFESERKGQLLITYDPGRLPGALLAGIDIAIVIPESPGIDEILRSFGCATDSFEDVQREAEDGDLIVIRRTGPDTPPELTRVIVGQRRTAHVRHLHKYAAARLPAHRRFYFRNAADELVGSPAANMEEFVHELTHCEPDVISHHATGGDFSRWIALALADNEMAATVESLERRIARNKPDAGVIEAVRRDILDAVELRYIRGPLRT